MSSGRRIGHGSAVSGVESVSESVSVYLSVYLSIYLSICLSIYLSISTSVYMHICIMYIYICMTMVQQSLESGTKLLL